MTELPAWCAVGEVVIDHSSSARKRFRIRRIEASKTCRSGWCITLQKLVPPLWGEGRKLDLGWLGPITEEEKKFYAAQQAPRSRT